LGGGDPAKILADLERALSQAIHTFDSNKR
jgi:hypothetical protein